MELNAQCSMNTRKKNFPTATALHPPSIASSLSTAPPLCRHQDGCEGSAAYGETIGQIAARLSTLFVSTRHLPTIRYREARRSLDGFYNITFITLCFAPPIRHYICTVYALKYFFSKKI